MPTVDLDVADFERLLGLQFHGDLEKLDEALAFVKAEVKLYDKAQNIASIELKDTNRPDLWSAEGLSRGLRTYLKLERGLRQYFAAEPIIDVQVDGRLENIRPFISCSVVKNVDLADTIIRGLMHLQDKLDKTYGRSRQKTSIGIYNLDLIASPLSYTVVNPTEFSFIPLGFNEKMTLDEILERHPKGQEYGHIVKKHSMYPILMDAEEKVLSFPPVINSNDLGRVTEENCNLLIEVTGTSEKTVLNTLNLVTMALIDRGGKAYSAAIHYPKSKFYGSKKHFSPDFRVKQLTLDIAYCNRIIGLQLTAERIIELLAVAGLCVGKVGETSVQVLVPSYRVDMMHAVDVVEDVAVAYGYNNIEPLWRDLPTTGYAVPERRTLNIARELMVGAGYQETLNYTLTNPDSLFSKMNQEPAITLEISNPKLVTMTCLRNWLLPGLMEFLATNQSVEFPQRIFELGKVTSLDEKSETKTQDEDRLAAVTSHATASFSEIKSCLDSFLANLGVQWQIKHTIHPSFIEGRVGSVVVKGEEVGVIGEVSPCVLESWKLENPTAAFEVNIQRILSSKA